MNRALALKTGLLLLAFVGVVYAIVALNTKPQPDSNQALELLLGNSRPLNWCPEKTTLIEVYGVDGALVRKLDKAPEISMICELMINGFSNDGIDPQSYKKKMIAIGSAGARRTLEQVEKRDIYRVDGMPFSSPMLQKALERQGLSH